MLEVDGCWVVRISIAFSFSLSLSLSLWMLEFKQQQFLAICNSACSDTLLVIAFYNATTIAFVNRTQHELYSCTICVLVLSCVSARHMNLVRCVWCAHIVSSRFLFFQHVLSYVLCS